MAGDRDPAAACQETAHVGIHREEAGRQAPVEIDTDSGVGVNMILRAVEGSSGLIPLPRQQIAEGSGVLFRDEQVDIP